jgi:dienelactone hydrolase
VLLFHSILGLRPSLLADADRLRAAGHEVMTPDLLGGHVFDDIDAGMAYGRTLDSNGLVAMASAAADAVPGPKVYAGWSFGAGFAQWLTEHRTDAAGLLLFAGGYQPEEKWPEIPAQLHAARADEWVEESDVEALAKLGVDVFRYDGGHLFSDPGQPGYDAESTELMWPRVLEFLEHIAD